MAQTPEMVNQCHEPKPEPERTIPVIYQLSWSGKDEKHQLIDVPVSSSSKGLYLRDVINHFDRVRGKGMASMFSWSSKKRYKKHIVWQDLYEDDLIDTFEDGDYYLKGSLHEPIGSPPRPRSSSRPETREKLIIADGRPILPEDPQLNEMLKGSTAFNPDDRQLFHLLLMRKYISGEVGAGLIHEMDIYSTEPWNLASPSVRFELRRNKIEAFFFTSRQTISPQAQARAKGKVIRVKRTAGAGVWKSKGNKSEIVFDSRWVGHKNSLIFKMRDKSKCPQWFMHEYLLPQQIEEDDGTGFSPISIALCRIYTKPAPNTTGAPSLPPAPVPTSTTHEFADRKPMASPSNSNLGQLYHPDFNCNQENMYATQQKNKKQKENMYAIIERN